MTDAHLEQLLRRIVREELQRLQPSPLTQPQRRLLDALAGEFADGPFSSAEALQAAASPLARHEPLRAAIAALGLTTAHALGQRLRALATATAYSWPRVISPAGDHGSRVWAVEGNARD